MRRRLPPPNWLRAFEATARHLSFTGAAHELNVTQSAVSQQVKLLEHFLQQALFHRYPRRLELTDAGKAYLPTVREAFERLAVGTEELFGHERAYVLTIKVNVAFAALWLAPRLGQFKSSYPDLNLRITNSIWLDDPDWENIDLEIRFGKGQWQGLTAVRLTRENLFPVCSPDLLQGPKPLRTPQDLVDHSLLIAIGNEDGWPQWLDAAGVAKVDIARGLKLDTSVVAYEMAAAGAGIALGRSSLAEGLLKAGRLVAPFDTRVPSEESFYLVSPEHRLKHRAAATFRQWLVDKATKSVDSL